MNIAIIGGGYVGLHTALKLRNETLKSNITIFDISEEKIINWEQKITPIDDHYIQFYLNNNTSFNTIDFKHINKINYRNYDFIFLALATNQKASEKKLDISLIKKIVKEIKQSKSKANIYVRSTINLTDYKWVEKENLGYWPEFLSQGKETELNLSPPSIPISFITKTDKKKLFKKSSTLKIVESLSVKEAIYIKLFHNGYDAILISISNLFANLSFENNLSFLKMSNIVESLLQNRNKIKIPGIGYGGSCYPKDLESLILNNAKSKNEKLLNELIKYNSKQAEVFLNWAPEIKKAKKIFVLGISYKGKTNDLTKTPTKKLINYLIKENKDFSVWEPKISGEKIKEKWNLSLKINDFKQGIKESDLIIIASDWLEFNSVLKFNLRDKTIIDLKTCLVKHNIKQSNVKNYYTLGERKKYEK